MLSHPFNVVIKDLPSLGMSVPLEMISVQYQRLGAKRCIFNVGRSYNTFCNQINSKDLKIFFKK